MSASHPSSLPPPSPTRQRMTDLEWAALLPYLLHRSPQGRPLKELRQRMEGIFLIATTHRPWRDLPAEYGKADTVARYFRRLTHAGLWERLLQALADSAPTHPLWGLGQRILRACRRAQRILGLGFNRLIRSLGLRAALPGPPWLLPDPLLSETLAGVPIPAPHTAPWGRRGALKERLRSLQWLHRAAAGRARISRATRLGWP
ncbi:transposase [Pseudoroseomonas cervicalis]|uniref:transposase n=1 Tax=Teichococcus cervicalis TaxID=204525 RepID=UPI0034A0345C